MIIIDHGNPPIWTLANFHHQWNWTNFFPDALENLPTKCPMPYGDPIKITGSVDADYAQNYVTWCSVNDIMILINNMPLVWVLWQQYGVETSTFGSEIITAHITVELIIKM